MAITIKKAKELCKARFGRLPRMGYEMLVEVEPGTEPNYVDEFPSFKGTYASEIYLENVSGTYRVRPYSTQISYYRNDAAAYAEFRAKFESTWTVPQIPIDIS